ncbi:hypothetical protein HPHPA26_0641 [Helicobacter pylori Hp A-26]|uniref:Uncharacterized protein n=1 Tax=Helicobacter pylori Hp A-26 TaxID=992056 RepID=J0MRA4_HELPX|nr:hypothetical protein HPHPA26_0641 [Helicobacter pylori Hp A-26]
MLIKRWFCDYFILTLFFIKTPTTKILFYDKIPNHNIKS